VSASFIFQRRSISNPDSASYHIGARSESNTKVDGNPHWSHQLDGNNNTPATAPEKLLIFHPISNFSTTELQSRLVVMAVLAKEQQTRKAPVAYFFDEHPNST
jgi:hypothetical protein